MSANKDKKRGTWMVYIRYKDWQGLSQIHTKRGFSTKREALEYEREFLLKKSKDVRVKKIVDFEPTLTKGSLNPVLKSYYFKISYRCI